MAVSFSVGGIETSGDGIGPAVLSFVDSVLRGVGQVMLQNNSYTGLLFLIGIFYNSPLFAAGVLVGTSISTATAMTLGAERGAIRAGLFGFNGALVAIALLYFLQPDALTWGCVILAAALSTIVTSALQNLLRVWNVPALTAPFVFTALCFFLATARFARLESTDLLPTAGLPKAIAVEGVVTSTTIIEGLFSGIAQVLFQGNVISGVLFVVGLLISSRAACMAALVGSLIGLTVAWGMGAAEPAIRSGAFGFNSVLVAIAFGGSLFALDRVSVICGVLGSIIVAFVFAAISAALEPLGMPAMTLPFVLITWLFLFAAPVLPRLKRASAKSES